MNQEEKILKRKAKREKRVKTKEEFKKFIFRGNIIDLAVAVAVGSAFTAIVNSFVKDIIGGVMGYIMGDMNLSDLELVLGKGENAPSIKYGSFLETIIYFIIIAIVMFTVIKIMSKISAAFNKLEKKKEEEIKEKEVVKEVKVDSDEVVLLKEIRDLMKENKKV